MGRVHAAGTEETDSCRSLSVGDSLRWDNERTHGDTVTDNGGEILRRRGDSATSSSVRDTDRGVGVDEIEEELVVGDEIEAVNLGGCLAELSNELSDRSGGGSALLSERRAGKGKERSEGSNREHCVVKRRKNRLVEEEIEIKKREEKKRKTQTPELRGGDRK